MFSNRQLVWGRANRRAPSARTSPVGVAAGLVFDRLMAAVERRGGLPEASDALVDDDFRRHCRVGTLRSGVLLVEVNESRLVPVMRARWAGVLPGRLQRLGVRPLIRAVEFRAAAACGAGG